MGKLGGVALAALLALTSCASPTAEPGAPDPADPSSYKDGYSADEFFIVGVKLGWEGTKPRNTQLVDLGEEACEQIREGGSAPDLGVSARNTQRIIEYAKAVYCP